MYFPHTPALAPTRHSLSGPLRGAKAANAEDAVTFWSKDGGGLGSLVLQFRGNMLATQQRDALARTVGM